MVANSIKSCVTVFGGSGFLGDEIVKRLAAEGIATRVAVRHPDKAKLPKRSASDGEIVPIYADVRDQTSVALAMEGCGAVVNAVSLYVEHGAESFEAVHELGARNVAHQATVLAVDRLVHISGIGADPYSRSPYVRARGKGEVLVADVFPRATIFRPSVLFGPEDKFVNMLAMMARYSPVLPLFGRGQTKLQPVYVGNVAEATLKALKHPDAPGHAFELGGPRTYSFRALIELVLERSNRRRLLLPVPFPLWAILAALASSFPTPPLTPAQVALMKRDNVVAKSARTLGDLGVAATALEDLLPNYAF